VGIGFGDILILAPIGAGGQHGRIPRRNRVSYKPPGGGGLYAKKRRRQTLWFLAGLE
jgi:hypothetical protein